MISNNKIIGFFVFLISTFAIAQEEQATLLQKVTGFSHPESVVFDEDNNVVYVSNIGGETAGDGYISRVDTNGEILDLKWIPDLNDPKGLLLKEGKLYVTDNKDVVVMDVQKEEIEQRIPVADAVFLNDITAAENGEIYISDSGKSSIYKMDNSGEISEWMNTEDLEYPNGLLAMEDGLYVAAWGSENPGNFLRVDPETKEIERLSEGGIGNLDGLQDNRDGGFYISDWATGKVHEVDREGNTMPVLTSEKSAGDILFLARDNKLVLPMNIQNSLYWYQLE